MHANAPNTFGFHVEDQTVQEQGNIGKCHVLDRYAELALNFLPGVNKANL